MKDSLELLLKDIYALEPSLRERDLEVRALVESFRLNKPEIKVSENFAKGLRAKLLAKKVAPAPQVRSIVSPWMSYVVSLGAMAILLLMLVPSYLGKQTSQDNFVPKGSYDAYMTPDIKKSGGGDATGESSIMMEEARVPTIDGAGLGINAQKLGVIVVVDFVSFMKPGFIVITRNENGQPTEVIGISYLLFTGYSEQIEIPLSSSMKAGQTFSATLYLDNGDGVFDLNVDTPIYDADGLNLVSQTFSTMP